MLSNSPTPTNADDVAVRQEDREAAADLLFPSTHGNIAAVREWKAMKDGEADSHPWVKAFARHRTAHQATGEVEDMARKIGIAIFGYDVMPANMSLPYAPGSRVGKCMSAALAIKGGE